MKRLRNNAIALAALTEIVVLTTDTASADQATQPVSEYGISFGPGASEYGISFGPNNGIYEDEIYSYTTKYVAVNENGKQIELTEPKVKPQFASAEYFKGYSLVDSRILGNGNTMVHTYRRQAKDMTTIRFTAKYNDGRAETHYSWSFPAGKQVSYGELFALAGLDPNDFDLPD